jgi:branched-chain amino acid transport system substrate-binding protein
MDASRLARVAALLCVAVLPLTACADDADAPDDAPDDASDQDGATDTEGTLRVGLLNPLTGPFTALGEDVNDGFRLYVDTHGGIGGYDVEVFVEDEANDAAAATEAAERLVERSEVDVILGFVNSGVAYGAAGYIADAGVPLLISVAGADDLTQRDAVDNIFRLSYTGSMDAMPGGAYACEELGYETAAVIGLDYAFGWEGVGGFARAYEDAGCDVIQEIYVPLDTQDWAPFVQQLDTDADVVWVLNAGPDAIRFVQAYRDFGVPMPLIGHGSATDEEVLEQQQALAEGMITTLHYSRMIDTPENTEFVESFEETYGRSVSRYAEAGWSAGLVLEEALGGLDTVDYDTLSAAIADVRVDAPRGPISFDAYGQAIYNVYVREVQEVDGDYQNVVIDEYPEVSQFWTYDPEEYLDEPPYADLKDTWAE